MPQLQNTHNTYFIFLRNMFPRKLGYFWLVHLQASLFPFLVYWRATEVLQNIYKTSCKIILFVFQSFGAKIFQYFIMHFNIVWKSSSTGLNMWCILILLHLFIHNWNCLFTSMQYQITLFLMITGVNPSPPAHSPSISLCWTSALIHLFNWIERHSVSLNQEKGFKCKFPFVINSWKCQRQHNHRLQKLLKYFTV